MMQNYRIKQHPILPVREEAEVMFTWQGQVLAALEGETIAAALFANGIRTFGNHHKDGSPQGIFCANGQCAQCMVLVDGLPVKACMELVTAGMRLEPVKGLPVLPKISQTPMFGNPIQLNVPVLIIGGGPAGLSAAIQLAKAGIRSLIVDDKHRLGGKLVLQTHRFFGSHEDVFAGTRGINIASRLEAEARVLPAGGDLAAQHCPGSFQRQKSWHPERWKSVRSGQAAGALWHRGAGKIPGVQGQHSSRRIRRRRISDPGQSRSGASRRSGSSSSAAGMSA